MAGQQGFLYEGRIHNKLKAKKLVPPGFTPAGSDANAPDAMFLYGGRPNKLEVKLDLKADYGQGSFTYNNGIWQLGGAKTAAAEELRGLAVENKIPIVSATQTTRSGYSNTDVGLEDTSESFGLPATADLMFAIISTEQMEELGQILKLLLIILWVNLHPILQ